MWSTSQFFYSPTMRAHSLPSPPAEEIKSCLAKKGAISATHKSVKSANRAPKRANSGSNGLPHDRVAHAAGLSPLDGRQKRVWKACERCRMKKTKCDGEFPCKRCKDDGMVCTAGVRKKVEYKQLPKGYAEVLETTQFALIATVHKLYSMLRRGQPWGLGEPELNDRGQPVIHNIAQKLGCIRPNCDIDLPVHSVFPEDAAGMEELARQLKEQQAQDGSSAEDSLRDCKSIKSSPRFTGPNSTSSSDPDHSDGESDSRLLPPQDFRRHIFKRDSTLTLSPSEFTSSRVDYDFSPTAPPFSTWSMPKSQPSQLTMQYIHQTGLQQLDGLNPAVLPPDFGDIEPPDAVACPNPDVMMGISDPMIYSGFDSEAFPI